MVPGMSWYVENGCKLQQPMAVLAFVFESTRGRPCDGCNCKATCPAWPKLQGTEPAKPLSAPIGLGLPRCEKCRSPLNMSKVQRRGGRCACGAEVRGQATPGG